MDEWPNEHDFRGPSVKPESDNTEIKINNNIWYTVNDTTHFD